MKHLSVSNGVVQLHTAALFHCGCGDVTPRAKSLLIAAGCGSTPLINTSADRKGKQYIIQVGLNHFVPSLNKARHAVLFNPKTNQFIDLLNVQRNDKVLNNIYSVVRGI